MVFDICNHQLFKCGLDANYSLLANSYNKAQEGSLSIMPEIVEASEMFKKGFDHIITTCFNLKFIREKIQDYIPYSVTEIAKIMVNNAKYNIGIFIYRMVFAIGEMLSSD